MQKAKAVESAPGHETRSCWLTTSNFLFKNDSGNFLEPRFDVVGTATDGIALWVTAQPLRPDGVVIDMTMPLWNGLEAGRKMKQVPPQTNLVLLAMHRDPVLADQAMGRRLREPAKNVRRRGTLARDLCRNQGKKYVTAEIVRGMRDVYQRSVLRRW